MFFFRFFVALLYIAFVSSETYCPNIPEIKEDRRSDKGFLRIMQYNVEWLFTDYYKQADCPGNNCTWKNETQAQEHLTQISKVINKLNPDIINLCEVEGCDELNEVIQQTSNTYKSYMIKGTDTSTGQNVGMITKIDPELNLQRTDERVTYPLPFQIVIMMDPKIHTV
jgi:predicted extracellular nuclease